MPKLDLSSYVELLDRILERKGFSPSEREEIMNDQANCNLIYKAFDSNINPTYIIDKLNVTMIRKKYEPKKLVNSYFDDEEDYDLDESKKHPKTVGGKQKKFKKVMKEFGKGKLKPFHAKHSLKSKKQDGSKKERKQALAIAFSEAGLTKESVQAKYVCDFI
jgi:hypothetical protein